MTDAVPGTGLRLVLEDELRRAVGLREAIDAVRDAFRAAALGKVRAPEVVGVEIPEEQGEFHVKGAHVEGLPYFVLKVASGFWSNPARGLPVGSGLMIAFDARTGAPRVLLLDNGFLTDLRTGAAGAVAADLLARRELRKVALVGAGVQARFQLRALALVRRLPRVEVWSRNAANAERCAAELRDELGADVRAAADAQTAVGGADLVVTTTPSREPVLRGAWIEPGCHVTAVGSDAPEKRELDAEAFARADLVFADRLEQCLRLGEIHHAVASGALTRERVAGEIGDLVCGRAAGRTRDDQLTIADLTGLGAQDAAIACLALRVLDVSADA